MSLDSCSHFIDLENYDPEYLTPLMRVCDGYHYFGWELTSAEALLLLDRGSNTNAQDEFLRSCLHLVFGKDPHITSSFFWAFEAVDLRDFLIFAE